MQQIYNIILLIFIIFIDISLSAKKTVKQVNSREDALSWFDKYGYNPCLDSKAQCSISLPSILEDYQERFHLKVTGILDDATKKHMSRSRCGNKDKPVAELSSIARLQQYKLVSCIINIFSTWLSNTNKSNKYSSYYTRSI